jgi:hypothetical protein
MVSSAITDMVLYAQQAERKVPEPTRTMIMMALLGIVLLGLLLVAFAMLGASWVRKQGFRRRSVVPTDKFLKRDSEASQTPVNKLDDFSTTDTFTGDDTVSGDDTVAT